MENHSNEPRIGTGKPGPGRPEGSLNKLVREARKQAAATGRLPHEILLDIARGKAVRQEVIDDSGQPVVDPETGVVQCKFLVPDLDTIRDAAKAAAPYFAPKISTVEVIRGVDDDELDRIIALAASEAGVSVGFGGAEQEAAPEGAADSSPARGRVQLTRRAT